MSADNLIRVLRIEAEFAYAPGWDDPDHNAAQTTYDLAHHVAGWLHDEAMARALPVLDMLANEIREAV